MILDPSAPHPEKHSEDEIVHFWDSMEKMVELPAGEQTEEYVNSGLVGYVKCACDSYMNFINSDRDLCRMAMILTDSPIFKNRKAFCMSKLLSLLNIDLLEMNMKFIIAYILLWESKNNLNSLVTMLEFQGFNVFYNTLYTQFAYLNKYGEEKNVAQEQITNPNLAELTDIELKIVDEMKQISTVLMDLLFQIFKYCKCSVSNVQIVDDFFVYFLMVSIRSDTMSDMFNNAQFKVLLALNEQYMMLSKQYEIENKVFKYLSNNSVPTRFTELLLLKFNRVQDKSLQIMMCKVLYLILTAKDNSVAMNFFYLNDLNVFVDVLIRELQNISENEESLRNYFLRVILPLLKNTELSNTHYRKDDLVKLLKYLSSVDNICSSDDITREHQTTARLALKVLNQVDWLEHSTGEEECSDSDGTGSRKSSISALGIIPMATLQSYADKRAGQFYSDPDLEYSAESLGKRKARPPPPLPPSRKVVASKCLSKSPTNTNK